MGAASASCDAAVHGGRQGIEMSHCVLMQAVQAACISLAQQLADGKSAQGLQYPDLAISADPLTASLMLQQMAEDASAGAHLLNSACTRAICPV